MAGFFEVEHEPVAVVVVAGVLLVELREGGFFVGRADVFAIPVGDQILAVGVGDGDVDEDDFVTDFADFVGFVADHAEGEFGGALGAGGFGGVHAGVDPDEDFALLGDLGGFVLGGEAEGHAAVPFLVLVELADVFLRADEGDVHGFAGGRFAVLDQLEAGRGLFELLVVGDDVVVVGELVVGTGAVAEVLGGSGYGSR